MNLVQQRGGANVWDCSSARWDLERWIASMVATGLLSVAVRRRSATGLLLGVAAGALGWWAMCTPEDRQYRRGQLRAVLPATSTTADPVGEASEDSFPASDAPSWTPKL